MDKLIIDFKFQKFFFSEKSKLFTEQTGLTTLVPPQVYEKAKQTLANIDTSGEVIDQSLLYVVN